MSELATVMPYIAAFQTNEIWLQECVISNTDKHYDLSFKKKQIGWLVESFMHKGTEWPPMLEIIQIVRLWVSLVWLSA